GFTVGSVAAGGGAAVLVARVAPARRGRAARLAGSWLGLVALAGYRAQPGAPSLVVYGAVVAVAVVAWVSVLTGALGRLERDPVPAPARGLGGGPRGAPRGAPGGGGAPPPAAPGPGGRGPARSARPRRRRPATTRPPGTSPA